MRIITLLICCCMLHVAHSQETSRFVKFGKITPEDLQKKIYSLDSGANAVVLSDIGEAAIQGNTKGWFSILFKRHRVVHILNKSGYDESNVTVPLYTDGDNEERLNNVKAVTYNLEGGKVVETKLEKSGIFKEQISKNLINRKFTFPNVKEGCIIEYQYEVESDYIWNLDPWEFQGSAPVLWSEYTLSVPEFFSYAFLSHGYHRLYINEKSDRRDNFTVMQTRSTDASDRASFTAGVTDYRWVMKDVPEFKQEMYTSAVKNHISRIEFQLSSQNYPLTPHDYRNSWGALIHGLSESEYFGASLKSNNGWLGDELKPVLDGAKSEQEKAQKIYAYVRDNFICTEHNGLQTGQSLKNIMKAKKGTVSEINLLLTAMFRYAGLKANAVILSTTDHGYALQQYPLITSFNYVVSDLKLNEQDVFLDASYARLGFGKMMPRCYNGHARVVDEWASPVMLSADSIKERKVTVIFIANDDKGKWMGSTNQTPGYYESYDIREKLKEKGKEEYFRQLAKKIGTDIQIRETRIDSLNRYEDPLSLHYEMEFAKPTEDILYVNPLFGEARKKNPFSAAERFYPVEMPFTMDETVILTMEVPEGYVVDELPKQLMAKLDEQGSASFEYRISQSGSTISMRTRVTTLRTLFLPEEYDALREFFNLIVNKQNEQIVFKKKK